MRRRTLGWIVAFALIIVLVAVFVLRRDGAGTRVDVGSAARKAVFRSSVTASGEIVASRYADIGASAMGRLVELPVQEGEMVVMGIQNQPGSTLMTISDSTAIDAEVKVAEADVLRVRVGQTASISLQVVPGTPFSGRVVEIGASALPVIGTGAAAREFKVKVRLDASGRELRPGLTCDTNILTTERQGVLAVPLRAVVIGQTAAGKEQPGVFVPEAGIARFRPVKTGLIGGLDIEVSGLAEGTAVVVGPFQALRDLQDGQPLRVQAGR